MTSADSCRTIPPSRDDGSQIKLAARQTSRDKRAFFHPVPAGFTTGQFENHGFYHLLLAHPLPAALYPVSVRQGVIVAPASFKPHLAVTQLPSLNGYDSLYRRGLTPPRTGACPAYKRQEA